MEEMEEEEEGCVWKEEEVVVLEQQLSEEKRRNPKGEAGYPPWSTTWSTIPNLNLVSQPICLFFL